MSWEMPHHVCENEHFEGLTPGLEPLYVCLAKLEVRIPLPGPSDHFPAEINAHAFLRFSAWRRSPVPEPNSRTESLQKQDR